jgi:hypothetical protein
MSPEPQRLNDQNWKKVGNQLQCPHCRQFDPLETEVTFEDRYGKVLSKDSGSGVYWLIGISVWIILSIVGGYILTNFFAVFGQLLACFLFILVGILCFVVTLIVSGMADAEHLAHLQKTAVNVHHLQCQNCNYKATTKVLP